MNGYRREDAGDLRKGDLNESVKSMTCLNAVEGKIWKSKKSNQNIVMNEEFVKNFLMNGEFVNSSVTNAKIDPKVVMDLSIFKIGVWNNLQPSNQKYWKK